MELGLSADLTQQTPTETNSIEWETWGEESTVELCEVQLTFDGLHMSEHAEGVSSTLMGLTCQHRTSDKSYTSDISP